MHSFSPLRFDLAKQMPFAVSQTSRLHDAVSISPLEKNLRPASKFADLSRSVAFRDAPVRHNVGYLGTNLEPIPAKRPAFNIAIFGAAIAFRNCGPTMREAREVQRAAV